MGNCERHYQKRVILSMILVTGATGVVGRNLILSLSKKHNKIIGQFRREKKLDETRNFFVANDKEEIFNKIIWKKADITNFSQVQCLFEKVVEVYHCAAYVSMAFYKTNYLAEENKNLVKNKLQINENIKENNFQLIDARGKKRFDGLEVEPRVGLNSGHIQNSINLPFLECINKSNHTFKSKEELIKIFQNLKISNEKNQVFTCGSGVTACILAMANKIISDKNPVIYDGSWSEYGLK